MAKSREVETAVKSVERVRDRRQQLVEAAVEVFMARGYHATTVRDIGAAANLTQGTIYNYVRTKDDILYLACDYVVTAYFEGVRRALEDVGEHGNRIEAIVRALVEVMYEYQDYILLLYHESHALDRESLRPILARVEEFNTFIGEALVDAGLDAEGERLAILTNLVTYIPTMVALRRWLLDRSARREAVVDAVVQFILSGLDGMQEPVRRPAAARTGTA
jgi:AcrR family transcriptional regulator